MGLRLQEARQAAGLTQQELCQKSGLSYSTLAKIERGAIKSPSIFTVQQIAGAIGASVDTILGVPVSGRIDVPKKRSKSGISFVYFDINGCLVRFFHRAFAHVAADTGVSSDIVEKTFWHYNDAVCSGKISMQDFNKTLARKFDVPHFDWAPYYLAAVDPIDETVELLKWVQENYRLGLLSNIPPGLISSMRTKGIIPNIPYDTIVDSSEVGLIKPDQKIYELAAKEAKAEPSEILLIDDSRANLMAAERQDWHVLWFDDYRPDESVKRAMQALEF